MAARELWSIRTHISAVVLIGLAVFGAAAGLLWFALGLPTALNTRVDIIKIALSVVAGVGGVVALVVAYRKQRISESAEKREHAKVLNERFATACNQIGHDKPTVRLAASTRWRRSPTSGPSNARRASTCCARTSASRTSRPSTPSGSTTRRRRCACRSPV